MHVGIIRTSGTVCAGLFTATLAAGAALSQDLTPTRAGVDNVLENRQFSPYAGRNFPSLPLWGDTHLHTSVSVDAGTMNRLTQEDALRFARGEEVTATTGVQARLSRPLDFVVVTDHAEMYGLMPQLLNGDAAVLETEAGAEWYQKLTSGDKELMFQTAMQIVGTLSDDDPPIETKKIVRNAWRKYTALADRYNDPGHFTALIGYEYTTEGGDNLHRNVIIRGNATDANQTFPFSQYESKNPEDLWRFLAEFEDRTGVEVMSIPHNGNLSNGRMFSNSTFAGAPLTAEVAELRARFEKIMEVTQIKGDGETHPTLSPDDPFADFDTWDVANVDGTEAKTPDMIQFEYSREALKNGMRHEAALGVNPFELGMIGSTDAHTGLSAVGEDNFFGKHSGVEPEPNRWEHLVIEAPDPKFNIYGWQQASAGYAAVWARENTREAIFDAMARREVFATTGSRLMVRFFGGWDFTEADTMRRYPAFEGYRKGVPMGGNLRGIGEAPTFLVAAVRDPFSGNIDRIQIIKGWVDGSGETQEKVYDVVWGGDREIGADGKLPPVGNTVNVATANWTNTIGASELIGVWKDPDFDPSERAFYYARVIEIPTPRWTAYEALRFGVEMSDEVPMITTERAYTSPIWYTPKG
jgi:hypothetical protein